MKKLADIVNFTIHPVVLTIPGIYFLTYGSTKSHNAALFWTLISLIFSGMISLFVVIGVKRGFFNNLDVSNRKQRIILYPVAIVVVLLFALIVHLLKGPVVITYASISFVAALGIMDLINRKIKASIHVASVSAFVTGIILAQGGLFILLLLLIPLVAWARIIKKRHTLSETIVGAVAGVGFTVISIYIVQFIR